MTPVVLEKSVKKLPDERNVLQITDSDAIAYKAANCFFLKMEVLDIPEPISTAEGTPTNAELREIVKIKKPPQAWFDGDEEQLF